MEIKCAGGIRVFLGGREVRDDEVKVIATSDYVADGGSGLAEFKWQTGAGTQNGLRQVPAGDEALFVPGTYRLRADKPLMRRAVFRCRRPFGLF